MKKKRKRPEVERGRQKLNGRMKRQKSCSKPFKLDLQIHRRKSKRPRDLMKSPERSN